MLSLIVSTLGRTRELEVFLESLTSQSYTDFEVIIVDQNQDNCLIDIVLQSRWPFSIKHIKTPDERGTSRGRNHGLRYASGDIVLFPDDDCWYPVWFLEKGVGLLEEKNCVSVSGRAADETGRSINGRFAQSPTFVNRNNIWTTQIEWVVFFKKKALLSIGGYNEELGIGCETPWQAEEGHDVTLRLLEQGFKAFYTPELYGHHKELFIEGHDEQAIKKGRSYARGFGRVLRVHNYGLVTLLYWVARSMAKVFISALRLNKYHALYYMNVSIGRIEGYLGKTFS